MRGTNNLPKKNFLAQIKIAQNFHYFCKVRLSNFHQKFNFPKITLNCGETLLLMRGTNNFAKKYFLSTI